jgi:Protein of unknown function (DUF2924)
MSHRDIALDWTSGANGAWFGRMPKRANRPQTCEPAQDLKSRLSSEISRLSGLQLSELKTAWAAEFRRDPPKGLWRDLLLRTLAWRLQEKAFGGHDRATLKLLEAYGQKKAGDARCQRLKAGTVLVREFGGIRHTVTIMPEGFVWQEQTYSSLTAIVRVITGTNWNGPRFFGLREGEGSKTGKQQKERAA